MNQLQVIELSKVYPGGVQALAVVSFTLEKGEFLSVIGPSGSGKTTLFRILNGTEQAASGQVLYDKSQHFEQARGRKKRAMQKRIGTVYQDFCLVEQASCLDNVLNAALPDMGSLPGALGLFRPQQREEAAALLARVGLADKRTVRVNQLSGGQKQRVAIAGIIAMEPKCVVLDEPTAMLDPIGRQEVLETILKLNREQGTTVVLITHHMDEAALADRLIVMNDGNVIADGAPKIVFQQVDELKRVGLTVPDTIALLYRLRQAGVDVPLDALSVEECAAAIQKAIWPHTTVR